MSGVRGVLVGILGVVAAAPGCGARPLVDPDAAEQREPVQLAAVAADQSLWDISVDATGVYFAVGWYPAYVNGGAPGSDTAGAVRRVPRAGGEVVELWQGQGVAYGVRAGASAIYVITYE